MSLDTLANVKTRLGITTSADDTMLGLLQNSADALIADYCNRDFAGGTYTEYHPGGSEFVHLRNYPIASITSVNVDPMYTFGPETIVDPSAYVVHTDWGVVQSIIGPFCWPLRMGLVNTGLRIWTRGPRIVQVIYTTAINQVPADILEAYARLIGLWYRRAKTESGLNFQNITRQKQGDSLLYFASDDGTAIPADVAVLLASYRVPNL